jgi:1-phosphofructokinase
VIGTVTLNPSIDQNWILDDFVKDDANRARQVIETPGGKGINVSKVVRELGGKTQAYAFLGGSTGVRLKELAAKLDFPLRAIPISQPIRTNIVITDLKDSTQTRMSAPGPDIKPAERRQMVRELENCGRRFSYWVFGGSLPKTLSPTVYRDMIMRLQRCGTPCVLDTDNEALVEGLNAKPFMIKPNEFEMQRLTGKKLATLHDYLTEARSLVRFGIGLVVVSLGSKGALFVDTKQSLHLNAPKVKVRSHVGAGDSLIGGLLLGLQRKMKLQDAAKWGIAASTSAVMREAPRLCHREDIPNLMRRIMVKNL